MKACPECGRLTEKLVNGGLSASELEACRQHAETCEECRQVLKVHQALGAAGEDVPEPSAVEFQQMRERVFAAIAASSRNQACLAPFTLPSRRQRGGFAADAWQFLRAHPVPAGLVMLIVIAGAAFAGRRSASPAHIDDALLLNAIRQQTSSAAGLGDYWDEPFACTNVSVRSLNEDQLSLSFDVSRHVELVTSRESDLAKGVLVHAILEPAPLGARLKAMGLAEEIRDARLQEAVRFALARDPNPSVRLKALEVLMRCPFDSSIQDALLATLRQDPSVQMRLEALEYLARQQNGPEILRRSIEDGVPSSDPAIVQRAVALTRNL